ncbi:MAG: NUDIX domain-containing protein [Synergistaceae bacterium]|jgi:8-oxo-dGTP diphosphatase|nr:NUDIX domain-containing protein [Synergistaceae bacterium]
MASEPWDSYAYTALIVFCFLFKDGKVLLIKRANEPYKGEITVPGGRKKRGESLRDACAREMLEETGYVLDRGRMEFVGVLHAYRPGDKMEYLSNYFICDSFTGEMRASDEGELLWVDAEESMTLPGVHPFYKRLLPEIFSGNLPVEIFVNTEQ